MVFRVDLDHFAEAVSRLIGQKVAAVSSREGRTVASAADPQKGIVVAAVSGKPALEVSAFLKSAGFEVMSGEWLGDAPLPLDDCDDAPSYVAAVAYKSRETMPGLWMDAFPFEPTQGEVLKAMYDEFATHGELDAEIGFEEFLRHANANVVILSPGDIIRFSRNKDAAGRD